MKTHLLGLAAFVSLIPMVATSQAARDKRHIAMVDVRQLASATVLFQADTGRYPTAKEGLQALVKRPDGLPNWHGPYVKNLIRDPWGHPFHYKLAGKGFVILSYGADGRKGGRGVNEDIASGP